MATSVESGGFDKEAVVYDIHDRYKRRGHEVTIEQIASTVESLAEGAFIFNFIVPLAENELKKQLKDPSNGNGAL